MLNTGDNKIMNIELKENDTWTKEKVMNIDLLLKSKDQELDDRDKAFMDYVSLKQSFIDQAVQMCNWINENKEVSWNDRACDFFFMDTGSSRHKPDRYAFRCAVFNSIKDKILNDKKCNPYEIVQTWDMWYHS